MEYKVTLLHKPLWELYQKIKGRILITEDFQEEPNRAIKELHEYIGMEFKEEYLKFKPLIEEGIPEEWKYINLQWYDTALTSSELKPGKTDPETIKIDDEEVNKAADSQMKYYHHFLEATKKESINGEDN
eukprot:CAMPEP_0170518782 /NCGR_PEP_ID=MMETSP0209-20121228/4398_1 /TAXON_ID=665100 ORGANISM="Litonotus pictus, Strain P1" /NCGR_SAMPLE_ID=MMETSP0209 /ASSEMBLY_ACC=CAM_ASM_000301 /LENGTH=129 /DNA_ID=CAMNT_0010804467 /DNA_START=421 /DNA_END=810 /DNA_ORIENTATION=-